MPLRARMVATLAAVFAAIGTSSIVAGADQTDRPSLVGVAATVNGVPVLERDLDEWVRQHEAATYQRLRRDTYESRRAALEALLSDRLVAAEADRQGVTREELIEVESARRVKPVTDADVASFLVGSALPPGVTTEMLTPTVTALLRRRAVDVARDEYLGTLRRAPASRVEVFLEPPRTSGLREAHNPTRGRLDAPVEVVVFSDFECPFCRRAEPVLARLVARFSEDVLLVWKHYPLSIHAHARPAAEAAQCAHAQGRFWAFHDALLADADVARVVQGRLDAMAAGVGLDPADFARCVQTRAHQEDVVKDSAAGERAGVTGTPTVFINGIAVVGSQPYEVYERLVLDELERVTRPRAHVVSEPASQRGDR